MLERVFCYSLVFPVKPWGNLFLVLFLAEYVRLIVILTYFIQTKNRKGVEGLLLVTLHSYKDGTGKTLLSMILAMIFGDKRKRVCLLDLDLRAPSLSSSFQ